MTDTTTERDSALRRLKKLLALAGDSAAAPGEAANALRMAQNLMAKYQLNEVSIATSEIDEASFGSTRASTPPPWEGALMGTIGRAFGAKTIWNPGRGPKGYRDKGGWTVLAAKPQLEMIVYAVEVLRKQIIAARAKYVQTQPSYWTRPQKANDADVFAHAYVRQLSMKVSTFANAAPLEKALTDRVQVITGGTLLKNPTLKGTQMAADLGAAAGANAYLYRAMNEGPEKMRLK